MTSNAVAVRLGVLAACFFGTVALTTRASAPAVLPAAPPLDALPGTIDTWTGAETPPFDSAVLATLGADDYLNRIYTNADEGQVALYVGYYRSQSQGDAIHSPLNCLPGAGWQAASRTRRAIDVAGSPRAIVVNQLLVEKGIDRQVVLYWYQSQGRVEASEYWSKAYLVWDSIRHHRSDAALVRIVTPVLPTDRSPADAEDRAAAFVERLFPHLERLLPT